VCSFDVEYGGVVSVYDVGDVPFFVSVIEEVKADDASRVDEVFFSGFALYLFCGESCNFVYCFEYVVCRVHRVFINCFVHTVYSVVNSKSYIQTKGFCSHVPLP
jgi:hypothetical protein